jgi:Zn-dependent protease
MTLFAVRGVPVRAHWTLLLVVPYLAIASSKPFGVIGGVFLALALFASVAVHELAHVGVALRCGGRVRAITLMLVGGVSHITRMPPRPANEAKMAAAGPLASLGLGAVLAVASSLTRSVSADLALALVYVALMNAMVGVFNLLPAFPMDGGRIVRAALVSRWGTVRATRAAALVGRGLALAMVVVGVVTGSLLLVLVAVLIYAGAGAETEAAVAQDALAGLTVRDLMPSLPRAPSLGVDAALADAIPRLRTFRRPELIIVDEAGAPAGVLAAADLARIPPGARLSTPARAVLPRLLARHVTVSADAPASEALERAAEEDAGYVIVTDPRTGELTLLYATDMATAVALRVSDREHGFTSQARTGAA